MRELVRKELSVNKGGLIIAFVLPIYLLAIIPTNNKIQLYLIFSGAILISTMFIIHLMLGDKNHKRRDILFLSLPINRKYIIKSKYLVHSLFPLIFSMVLYLFISFIKLEALSYQKEVINLDIVVISTSISLIASAFLIPILFKWEKISPFMYALIIIMNSGIYSIPLHIRHLELFVNYGKVSIGLLIIAISLYLISMKLSERIFKNQVMNI